MTPTSEHSRKIKIVLSLIVFFVLCSFAPTFYEWSSKSRIHDDRTFELVHNFPTDYNLYLSRIREGKEGAWLATEKYTSEPHAGSLSQILYVVIGRLADYSHVQTPYVWFAYHVARAFFAALLLWVIWKVVEWVMREASDQWQIISYLLIVTASTWPKFEWVAGWPRFGGYMPWYTMADSLQRTTFMPHVTLAQALLAFIVLVFSGGFITKKLPGNWVFLGLIGILLGIVFPPGLLFLYGVLLLVTIGEGISLKKNKRTIDAWWVEDVFGRFIFGILTIPTVAYYFFLFQQYPWKRLVEFDVLHPTKFSYIEYFLAVGPVLPLGLFGIVALFVWNKKESLSRMKYFVAWVAAWLGFLFIFNQIPQQSPTRFTQMVPHVPLGIIAAYSLYHVSQLSFIKKRYSFVLFSLLFIPVALGLGSMGSSYLWLKDFVDHKLRATLPIVPSGAQVMYPMKEIIDGMTWLQVYTPRDTVVLSGMTTGNYIPVYAGNTAYVGHANTVDLENKLLQVEFFYTRYNQKVKPSDGMKWLQEEGIGYVFYGFEEQAFNKDSISDLRTLYPELELMYESPHVKIYKVNKSRTTAS